MPEEYAVIDLFAGPGGLAEGFSKVRRTTDESRPFRIALSVEKEHSAWETLRLRTFLRQLEVYPDVYLSLLGDTGLQPDWEAIDAAAWKQSGKEALLLELGEHSSEVLAPRLQEIGESSATSAIVIGGPPCQAYSLVGRARNRGVRDYVASEDIRHFLYREYINILKKVRPIAFVMENVRGLLSSRVNGQRVFELVVNDLRQPDPQDIGLRYKLFHFDVHRNGLVASEHDSVNEFLVHAELLGVPQARHRVIVVGVLEDAIKSQPMLGSAVPSGKQRTAQVSVAIGDMPVLRSRLSRQPDSLVAWRSEVVQAIDSLREVEVGLFTGEFRMALSSTRDHLLDQDFSHDPTCVAGPVIEDDHRELRTWLRGHARGVLPNNEARSHMRSDLRRYLFAAVYGRVFDASPKVGDFPDALAPAHRNWTSGAFKDRFRVQLWNRPSTTVTSHIAKDGHAFIHPDPVQCRSLTVREAARLQTFPDDYLFLGNRTQQYTQVGNAVPPFLARQIGEAVLALLEPTDPARGTN